MNEEHENQDPNEDPSPAPAPEATSIPEPDGVPPEEDLSTAMLAHLGAGLVGFFTGLGFLVPLIMKVSGKQPKEPFLEFNIKESLNFQITLIIAHFVALLLVCLHFGILNLVIGIAGTILSVIAGLKAQEGERYEYPACIRLVK